MSQKALLQKSYSGMTRHYSTLLKNPNHQLILWTFFSLQIA